MRTEAVVMAVVLLLFSAGLVAFVAANDKGCPEGQELGIVGWHWQQTGKTGHMQPTYGCTRD